VLRDPYLGMLSIPRDLWVTIPGYGENRINTAHFFAEADFTGSGPPIAIQTVNQNFGIKVNYYIRIRFDGFLDLIDLIGGIDVDIPKPMSGYTEGTHHMSSEQALAFVRDRDNSDDFYRMQRTQIILVAILRRMSNPAIWRQATDIMPQLLDIVDTDIPLSQFINLTITLLRVGWDDIDSRVITREYTHPFTTPGGAQVLEPDWNEIKPLISEMFGEE
jgi:LCP family protein required for cell wall assembly